MSQKKTSPNKEKLQHKEDDIKSLLHTLPVGVSILGEDRTPLYTNATLKMILKLSQEEMGDEKYRKRRYFRADGSEMPPDEFPSTRVFEEGEAIREVEIGILTESGEEIWTTVSAIPFNHGDWRAVLTTTDTTQQKEFEQALQKKTKALVERIKELNCLYGIGALVEQPNITIEKIFQGTAELIPPAWHHPEATSARITYAGKEFLSSNFRSSKWQQSREILTHGKTSGSVEVFIHKDFDSTQIPFSREEENLIYAIAERLGRISERFKAEKLLVELATTDPLTHLYNRRHYFELAEREIARAKRYQRPLSCIMIDIDYFKEINDAFGHLFGDKVLQGMVSRCQETIREVDIFARYGGDEFIMLLPEADLDHGKQLADRLCIDFRDRPLLSNGKEISTTLSLGVASMNGDDSLTLDSLLNRADEALYDAKRRGRNQVAIWEKAA